MRGEAYRIGVLYDDQKHKVRYMCAATTEIEMLFNAHYYKYPFLLQNKKENTLGTVNPPFSL